MPCHDLKTDPRMEKISNLHPCFGGSAHMNKGRIHLPVSPVCNIQCRFCRRCFNKLEQRPGVTAALLSPEKAAGIVDQALELCPEITVAGIAGPGDTLASSHAIETFRLLQASHPSLIKCLSTNGLLLPHKAEELWEVGVRTITVTVNAVDPTILRHIVSHIHYEGKHQEGLEAAVILIGNQLRGIRKMADLGAIVKVNTVLIPGINDRHIGEVARVAKGAGASLLNIIPLIPQHELIHYPAPNCTELNRAREMAEAFLPIFRHCQHCRADACGIPGQKDFSGLLYEYAGQEQTFSHG